MKEEGFTLIEVILLVALIGILSIPLYSLTSRIVIASKNSTDLYRETNEIYELTQEIYYRPSVDLLEGTIIEGDEFSLSAKAIEDDVIRKDRETREKMGENIFEYRKLNIGVKVYRGDKLCESFSIARFGILTEEEEDYYEEN